MATAGLTAGKPGRTGEGRVAGFLTGVALIAVAFNLRIAIAAPSPVLDAIERSTGISSVVVGLLSTVSVFCFGVFALATPRLIRRFGMSRLLWLTMVGLTAGILLRVLTPLAALFAGTALIGASIAVANVLLPALIKQDFSGRVGLMTGLYSMSLSAGAALSTGLTIPIEHATGMGWRLAMSVWALPAVAAIVLWGTQARRGPAPGLSTERPRVLGLWSDPGAWMVTAFMGLQSLGFYAYLTWGPTLLDDHHMAPAQAGWMISYSSFPAIAASLVTPTLSRRFRRPATMVVACVMLSAIGYLGLIVAPVSLAYLWVTVLGLGQGVSISLALGFIVARAPDSHHAAQLSTMAQGVGYLIACTGPFAIGAIHGLTSGWTVPLLTLTAVLVPMLLAGIGACRNRYVLGGQYVPA